jgi:hypothetical protein
MATYNKRGYKGKDVQETEQLQNENSTTAEVFSSLDEGASKTEAWVAANQTYILGVIGAIAVSGFRIFRLCAICTEASRGYRSQRIILPTTIF